MGAAGAMGAGTIGADAMGGAADAIGAAMGGAAGAMGGAAGVSDGAAIDSSLTILGGTLANLNDISSISSRVGICP